MNLPPLLCPVILPALFWAWYHYYKDRYLREPPNLLVAAFLLGGVSFVLGKLMYSGLDLFGLRYDAFLLADTSRPKLLLYSLFAIGPIEELAKLLPFLLIIRRLPEFDEPIDGIIYASFIALGFAAVENVLYLKYITSAEALARGFAGPVVHIAFASIWGYHIGRACLDGRGLLVTILLAFTATALLHGLYDFLVIAQPAFALPLATLIVLGLWIWRLFLIRDLHTVARATGQY